MLAHTAHADDEKSPGWALTLSVGATVGGTLLMGSLAGDSEAPPPLLLASSLMMFTGPSWGHVYTGDYDLAIGGTLLRAAGMTMIVEGMGDCVQDDSDIYAIDPPCTYPNQTPGLVIAGGILLFGTALAEIVDAPLAAKRYNRERAVTLTPTMTGNGRYGLSLGGVF